MIGSDVSLPRTTRRRFLQKTAATAALATTIGVWRSPSEAAAAAGSFSTRAIGGDFGAAFQLNSSSTVLSKALVESGADALRFPVRWDQIQVGPAAHDWAGYEKLLRELVWSGLKAVPVIVGCPQIWVDSGEARLAPGGLAYPCGPNAVNALGDFATEVLRFFDSFERRTTHIEIWNEPNAGPMRIDDPGDYARLVDSTALWLERWPVTAVAGSVVIGSEYEWRSYLSAPGLFTSARGLQVAPVSATDSSVSSYLADALDLVGGAAFVTAVNPASKTEADAAAVAEMLKGLASDPRCQAIEVAGLAAGSVGVEPTIDQAVVDYPLLTENFSATSAFNAVEATWSQT